MPALTSRRRRRTVLAKTAAILVASTFLFQFPAVAEQESEPAEKSDLPYSEGEISVPVGHADEEEQHQGTSLTATMAADSGVAVQTLCTNCNNADLSISGMGNEHVSLVCDGVPVPSGLAQIYLMSVMPPSRIDKVKVNKGAGQVGYLGSAVGGGIEIERTEPKDFQLNASGDIGTYDWKAGRLDLAGQSDWFGGYGVASIAESDTIDANGDGWANLPSFDRYTLEAGVDIKPSRPHRLRFGGSYYSEDQLDGPAAAYTYKQCVGLDEVFGGGCQGDGGTLKTGYNREDVQLSRRQLEGIYDLSIDRSTSLSFAGVFGDRAQDIQESNRALGGQYYYLSDEDLEWVEENFGLTEEELADLGFPLGGPQDVQPELHPAYEIEDQNLHGSIVFARSIGHQATARAGASVNGTAFQVVDVFFNRLQNSSVPTFPLDTQLEEELTETGFWAEGEVALNSRLELSAGVRYVDYGYSDNEAEINDLTDGGREEWLSIPLPEGSRWVPRATLTWKAMNALQLRFSAGAGFRAPAPAFGKVCCGRRYRGNRGVELEESRSVGIEMVYQSSPRWRLGVSAFVTDFDNLIVNMATQSDQWVNTYQNVNISEARNTSVSAEGRFTAPSWMTTTVSYTWLDPENLAPNGEIHALVDLGSVIQPRTFNYDGIPYANEGRGALGFAFALPPRMTLTFAAQYTGPNLIQSFYSVPSAAPPPPGQTFENGVGDSLASTEPFWVTNIRLTKGFPDGLTVYGGVDNVLDYTQGGGCTGDQAVENPSLVGCLGDPRYDFNWGPLRGRYFYVGLGYNFTKKS